jgi:orotidine-5'-phosphate decarboxylase
LILSFIDRLKSQVIVKKSAVMVGLDPRWESLPAVFRAGSDGSLALKAAAFERFCNGLIDAVAPHVAVVKPQAAFFEELGPAGMTALANVVDHAVRANLLVVMDGKRNDIGTTAEAYARAYLGQKPLSAWGTDALTVSPYLGDDSLEPFVRIAKERHAGIFVLVKTSNPGGKRFQDLKVGDNLLFDEVGACVNQLAQSTASECGYGLVGAVVGATYPEQLSALRAKMPQTWFLIPGYGAQGGGAKDCAPAFDRQGLGAVINNSRGINFAFALPAYREKFGEAKWQAAAEAATLEMNAALSAETSTAKLGQ